MAAPELRSWHKTSSFLSISASCRTCLLQGEYTEHKTDKPILHAVWIMIVAFSITERNDKVHKYPTQTIFKPWPTGFLSLFLVSDQLHCLRHDHIMRYPSIYSRLERLSHVHGSQSIRASEQRLPDASPLTSHSRSHSPPLPFSL